MVGLSVLPLLIKSIEVTILEGTTSKSKIFSTTMDYHDSKYGVFGTWMAQCAVVPIHGIRFGPILLVNAVWIMLASSVTGLIVWRWRRVQGQLKFSDLEELETAYRTRLSFSKKYLAHKINRRESTSWFV